MFGKFSFSDLYNKAKAVVSEVYSGAKQAVGVLKHGKDWVSEHVDMLSAIPFVGGEIKDMVEKVEETPFLFGVSLNDIGRGIDRASDFINSPYLNEASMRFDQIASRAASGADQLVGYAG